MTKKRGDDPMAVAARRLQKQPVAEQGSSAQETGFKKEEPEWH